MMTTAVLMALSCAVRPQTSWTEDETGLIRDSDSLMKVLTISDHADSLFLRKQSSGLTTADLRTDVFTRLSKLMLYTVAAEDGVGIAGPQVGIGRRVIAVQRFDKPGEPFEVFPNISITAFRGEAEAGAEGCLSVPGKRGTVLRYQDIDISYTSMSTLRDTSETVRGFTAVIFQHETDHLGGILYTDRLTTTQQ